MTDEELKLAENGMSTVYLVVRADTRMTMAVYESEQSATNDIKQRTSHFEYAVEPWGVRR